MTAALLGYPGFVGGNLHRQAPFDGLYNSKNIDAIRGRRFELVVISAAPAAKWIANREPEQDLATITALCDLLETFQADQAILISTVDVYPAPVGVDERSPIDREACQHYGRHRLLLEDFVRERFDAYVARLPGLFGQGLKKNVIFDYLNDNETNKIDTRNVFQFYSLEHLWDDIQRMLSQDIRLLNFATEPVVTADVARVCTGREIINEILDRPVRYDFRSTHAQAWGGRDGYLYSRQQVLDDLERYVASVRKAG